MKKRYYFFRIEANLLEATVCFTESRAIARRWVKKNDVILTDKDKVLRVDCSDYSATYGEGVYPCPNEIVECLVENRIVRRSKIK